MILSGHVPKSPVVCSYTHFGRTLKRKISMISWSIDVMNKRRAFTRSRCIFSMTCSASCIEFSFAEFGNLPKFEDNYLHHRSIIGRSLFVGRSSEMP